jgi:hypothetical protein
LGSAAATVLGNEASTVQSRVELRGRFPQLVQILQDTGQLHPASYHYGVITDLGIGHANLNNVRVPSGHGARFSNDEQNDSPDVPSADRP